MHLKKEPSPNDVFAEVSGSMGSIAVADAVAVIKRGRGESRATIHLTGRFAAERQLAMEFDADALRWTYLGDAEEFNRSYRRQRMLEIMKEVARPASPQEIYELLREKDPSVTRGSVRMLLMRMDRDGEVQRVEYGKYILMPQVRVSQSPAHASDDTGLKTEQAAKMSETGNGFRDPLSRDSVAVGVEVNKYGASLGVTQSVTQSGVLQPSVTPRERDTLSDSSLDQQNSGFQANCHVVQGVGAPNLPEVRALAENVSAPKLHHPTIPAKPGSIHCPEHEDPDPLFGSPGAESCPTCRSLVSGVASG